MQTTAPDAAQTIVSDPHIMLGVVLVVVAMGIALIAALLD